MSVIPSITLDHIGVVVKDLKTVATFFQAIGFDREEPFEVGGPWVDRTTGISGMQAPSRTPRLPQWKDPVEIDWLPWEESAL